MIKQKCEYCGRYNDEQDELCESCGGIIVPKNQTQKDNMDYLNMLANHSAFVFDPDKSLWVEV